MEPSRAFTRAVAAVEALQRDTTGQGPQTPRLAIAEGWIDEVAASTALAGAPLSRTEVAALLGRGRALGEHPLDAYVMVADYAAAARYVRDAPPASRRRPYLRGDEIVQLHALATRRSEHDRPGAWRATTLPPFPSGMVAPPAWLVPREIATFVERLAGGPSAGSAPLLWVATTHARFERIHPFATANGRVGRLVANLLLRRLGYPPLVIATSAAARYLAALRLADARDPWPLATLFASSVRTSLLRASAAQQTCGELMPLAQLGAPGERAALYKAAARGRLHAIRRGGALLSTRAWVEQYFTSVRRSVTG
jgi:hypothetical protein